jgi:hypothetical protein
MNRTPARKERSIMKKIKLMMVLLFLSTGTVMAQQAKVTSLTSKDLTEIRGREVSMITVEYAPDGVDPSTDTMPMLSFTCWRVQSWCR